MNKFVLKQPRKILFGKGKFVDLPNLLQNYKRLLVVTGSHFKKSDKFKALAKYRSANEIRCITVPSHEPVKSELDSLISTLNDFTPDVIIGIGGGSVLDSAKYFSMVCANPNMDRSSFFGVDQINFTCIPLILIPTTTGTGSEVTNISILKDDKDDMKKGIVSDNIIPIIALVDPNLCQSMPEKVAATSSFDAICHATEAYISRKSNLITDFFAIRALNLLIPSLHNYFSDSAKGHIEKLSEGSLLAGIAFANAGANLVHAIAYPLSSKLGISHGVSNAIIYPHVLDYFNKHLEGETASKIKDVFEIFKPYFKTNLGLKENLLDYLLHIGIKSNLSEYNANKKSVSKKDLDEYSSSVLNNDRLLSNSPCSISKEQIFLIYEALL